MRKFGKGASVLMAAIFLVALAQVAQADYAQTQVWFTVASSTSFIVTLPAQVNVTSNGTIQPGSPQTADIYFDSTAVNNASIMPCLIGTTNCQSADMATTPIFMYYNTGTAKINLTVQFNATLPTGVTVGMNSSTTDGGATAHTGIIGVNDTSTAWVVYNLDYTGVTASAFLNATFVNVAAGSNSRLLHHTSS